MTLNGVWPLHFVISLNLVNLRCRKRSTAEFMQESIVFSSACRRKESSRSLSHLLMSFLSIPLSQKTTSLSHCRRRTIYHFVPQITACCQQRTFEIHPSTLVNSDAIGRAASCSDGQRERSNRITHIRYQLLY